MKLHKCPSCGFSKAQPIDEKASKFFCPKCNHAWAKGEESKETQGSMDFQGVPQAKQLIDMVSQNLDMPAAMKSAFVAQLTGTFFEQWFEGFKAGLLADIVHKGEMYDNGKTRTGSESSDSEHRDGNRDAGNQHVQDGFSEQPPRKASSNFERVKERVAGIDFIRPKPLSVAEGQYEHIAEIVSKLKDVDHVFFDGTHYDIVLKAGIR